MNNIHPTPKLHPKYPRTFLEPSDKVNEAKYREMLSSSCFFATRGPPAMIPAIKVLRRKWNCKKIRQFGAFIEQGKLKEIKEV